MNNRDRLGADYPELDQVDEDESDAGEMDSVFSPSGPGELQRVREGQITSSIPLIPAASERNLATVEEKSLVDKSIDRVHFLSGYIMNNRVELRVNVLHQMSNPAWTTRLERVVFALKPDSNMLIFYAAEINYKMDTLIKAAKPRLQWTTKDVNDIVIKIQEMSEGISSLVDAHVAHKVSTCSECSELAAAFQE